MYLAALGRAKEARTQILRAQELDPLSLVVNTDIGFELYYNGQYDEAIKQLKSVVEMNPRFPISHLWLGRAYEEKRMYGEAIAEFNEAATVLREWPVTMAAIGFVHGVAGRKREARQVLADLLNLSKSEYVTSYAVALVYAGLGENDEAFAWLNRGYDERTHWLVWLKLDPRWNTLRSDPRFAVLLKRMGFEG